MPKGWSRDVVHEVRQVEHPACRVEQSWALSAVTAMTYQLHRGSFVVTCRQGGRADPWAAVCLERVQRLVIVACGTKAFIQRGRLDRTWTDCIASDAPSNEVGGNRLREPDHRCVRRAVGEPVRHPFGRPGDGLHVDDGTAAAVEHPGKYGPNGPVHGRYVDVDGEVPLVVRAVHDRAVGHEPGAVE